MVYRRKGAVLSLVPGHIISAQVAAYIQPESHEKINQDRRAQRRKREVDEVGTDAHGSYAQLISQVLADAESRSLHYAFEIVHT